MLHKSTSYPTGFRLFSAVCGLTPVSIKDMYDDIFKI